MTSTHKNAITAAKAYGAKVGITGRQGGWLYAPNGARVCQGWLSLVGMLTRAHVIVDVDGTLLGTVEPNPAAARQTFNKDLRDLCLRRNVFDGKPVQLSDRFLQGDAQRLARALVAVSS